MTQQQPRWRLFIDRPIQGALVSRALLYWAVTLMTQQLIVFLFVLATSGESSNAARLWWHMQLSIVAATVILPMVLLDVLKLSHRWVGPISRLRASLQALNRGERVPPLQFRERDFWPELANDFNAVTIELNRLRTNRSEIDKITEPEPSSHAAEAAIPSEDERLADARMIASGFPPRFDASPMVPQVPGWPAPPVDSFKT